MKVSYKGIAFNQIQKAVDTETSNIDMEKLLVLETERIARQYGNDCLNVQQLMQALNVGENHVYKLLGTELSFKLIGKRKVVPAVELARWLLKTEKNS